ncbi:rhodanese-like domain-containing protein [Ignavibacterium sp.]|jgi:rhodanese-related sulfurtransferase|uniref:rhodanese-like domain-containing protein n=1 Tax=Ignavibacterium sp. TaxID=2651167 RepID=UPI0025B7B5B7|nr:rhodanese-like domain-containing protein [Ignavibacterium sp.]
MFGFLFIRLMIKKNLLAIIFSSLTIGFIYNAINPNGIPLIREQRTLEFVQEDTVHVPSESLKSEISTVDSTNLVQSPITRPSDQSDNQNKNEQQEFVKPLAIKIGKAYQLYLQGAKFIDARMPEEFAEGHIKGAINIPFDGDESYRDILKTIGKDEIIVTYCSGTECDLSILLGDELFEKGYKRVYIFFGGWNDWLEKGYPISKGEQ